MPVGTVMPVGTNVSTVTQVRLTGRQLASRAKEQVFRWFAGLGYASWASRSGEPVEPAGKKTRGPVGPRPVGASGRDLGKSGRVC